MEMIEFSQGPLTIARCFIVGSNDWFYRPQGFYFKPEGQFHELVYGPYASDQEAKDAENKFTSTIIRNAD
jgi:hypothetical protein